MQVFGLFKMISVCKIVKYGLPASISRSSFGLLVLLSAITIKAQVAYAHVSHVLPTEQYVGIKSGNPDVEILATITTGFVVISTVVAQCVYNRRKIQC